MSALYEAIVITEYRLSYAMADRRVGPSMPVSYNDPVDVFLAALWPRLDAVAEGVPYEFEVCVDRKPTDPPPPAVYLDQITVWDCRRGIGSRLMREALAVADDHGIAIYLVAVSQGLTTTDPRWLTMPESQKTWHAWRLKALSQQQLQDWYEALGFRFDAASRCLLRLPGAVMKAPRNPRSAMMFT